jgi:peptidoglycan/LPS O-acetylase OafA/YrhL
MKLKYRPEIDGLRALAIIPVILFHGGLKVFSGGYIGVDVFFVISGYLITTILIEDMENDSFKIVHFYERRARRILPALFFVMLMCVSFAYILMLPSEIKDFSQSLVAVSLFVSNILFWQKTDYFASAAEEKPLLHTWSLAVEEQYYILFPIFLLLVWRFGKNRLFLLIIIMTVISFLFSEWGWRNHPSANFYFALTRAWELLAGSIAAFIIQKKGIQKNNLLSLIGLSAILFAIFAFDRSTPTPSIYTLVPILGTMLLIIYSKDTFVANVLRKKQFVGIGLISYSAYLWHQPLFAFTRIRISNEPSAVIVIALSLLSLLLAFLSWKFIENKFRNKNFISRNKFFALAIIIGILFISFDKLVDKTNGIQNRFSKEIIQLDNFRKNQEKLRDSSCYLITGFDKREKCVLGNKENIKGVLIGDSHAQMLWNPLSQKLTDIGIGMYSFTGGGCPPIFNVYRRDIANSKCVKYNDEVFNFLKEQKEIDFILLSGRWTIYVERKRFDNKEGGVEPGEDAYLDVLNEKNTEQLRKKKLLKNISDSLEIFLSSNKKIYVVSPVPEVGFIPTIKMIKNLLNNKTLITPTHNYDVFLERNNRIRSLFRNIEETDKVRIFDISNFFCNTATRRCDTFKDKLKPFYIDNDHLSSYGSEIIVDDFISWLKL